MPALAGAAKHVLGAGGGIAMLLGAASPAAAQCLLCTDSSAPASSSVDGILPDLPLRVDVIADLDFSRLVAGDGGGSITLDPHSGGGQTQGNVAPLGGYGFSGRVIVTGTPLRNVRISLPDSITLTASNGRTARVTQISTGEAPVLRLGVTGRLEFSFGGRLDISGNDDGDYRGRIPVTVSYE